MDDASQDTTSEARQLTRYLLITIGIIAFCGWLYAGACLALTNIREAAEVGDTEALSDLMDVPSVRESLKQEIKAAALHKIRENNENPIIRLALLSAFTPVADQLIDSAVTPETITPLILGKEPKLDIRFDPFMKQSTKPVVINLRFVSIDQYDAHMGYEGLSKFAVRYKDATTGKDEIVVILKRNEMSWQLSAIRLPVLR